MGIATVWDHPNLDMANPVPFIDWNGEAASYQDKLSSDGLEALVHSLGVPAEALESLGVGSDASGGYWTFPEKDAAGRAIGINRRYPDGRKKMLCGGQRGLGSCPEAGEWPLSADRLI